MARRRNARRGSPRDDVAYRRPNLGSHWRADGAPKTAYRSQADALWAADERRMDNGVILAVYRCEFCSAWHMGNPEGRGR